MKKLLSIGAIAAVILAGCQPAAAQSLAIFTQKTTTTQVVLMPVKTWTPAKLYGVSFSLDTMTGYNASTASGAFGFDGAVHVPIKSVVSLVAGIGISEPLAKFQLQSFKTADLGFIAGAEFKF